jgi:hypothetical protein
VTLTLRAPMPAWCQMLRCSRSWWRSCQVSDLHVTLMRPASDLQVTRRDSPSDLHVCKSTASGPCIAMGCAAAWYASISEPGTLTSVVTAVARRNTPSSACHGECFCLH